MACIGIPYMKLLDNVVLVLAAAKTFALPGASVTFRRF
jgi:hypothetical protein